MSHLNDELSIGDPMQNTLESFFISDDTPVNDDSCNNYFDKSIRDDCSKDDACFTSSLKTQDALISDFDMNGECTTDLGNYSISNSSSQCLTPCRVGEAEKDFRSIDSMRHPKQGEVSILGAACFGTNLPDGKDASFSGVKHLPFWDNNSRCSVCGLEFPPSFSIERQEHSVYHLAEMLQKE